jgi:hypothetical protein
MRTVRFWLAASLLTLGSGASGGADETEIDRLGNPPRLEIRGAESFQAEEIRQKLLADLDVANARYPTTSLNEFCTLLTAKTREAYLYAGFADVTVETAPTAAGDRTEVTIHEGRRYLAGEVVVREAKTIDASSLVQDLTVEANDTADAWNRPRTLWASGKPAWFNPSAVVWFRDEITECLLERGITGSQFTVEIVPDRETGLASLVITFADEGSAAIVNEVTVTGNKKNSQEEVLAYLGLQAGMRCEGDLKTTIKKKLWESGRFIKTVVGFTKPSQAGEPFKLTIDLVEYEKAPPLSQELSREEAALLKFASWLNRFADSQEEVVVTFDDEGDRFEFVVAPSRGYLALVRLAEDKDPSTPFAMAFVMSDERIGLYSVPVMRKIEGIPTPGRVRGNLDMTIHDGPPELTGYGRLTIGLGLSSRGKTHGLCRVRFKDSPVSILSLAHEYNSKLSWRDDVLTVAYGERELSLDAITGNLIEFSSRVDGDSTVMRRTSGEFERRLKDIAAADAQLSAEDQSQGPFTLALNLCCDTGLTYLSAKSNPDDRKAASVVRKMSQLGILEPFDSLVLAACRAPEEQFFIPDNFWHTTYWSENGEVNWPVLKYEGGYIGIQYADLLTSPGSWAWETWRETMFALAGKSRHLEQELVKHLSDPTSGPVRHLIIGELLRANEMTAMARVFGLAGQYRLTDEGFRHDYSALLEGDSFVGHCLLTLAVVLRHLDESEIQTLSKMLVEDEWLQRSDTRIFADMARRLRHDRDAPIANALSDALDAWWKAGLRTYVKKELQNLVIEPKPATATGQPLVADNRWRYRWHKGRWWYYGENGAWKYWTGQAWAAYPATTAGRSRARR